MYNYIYFLVTRSTIYSVCFTYMAGVLDGGFLERYWEREGGLLVARVLGVYCQDGRHVALQVRLPVVGDAHDSCHDTLRIRIPSHTPPVLVACPPQPHISF